MTMTLTQRVLQPDLATLPDWRCADILNTPDPALPVVVTLERTLVGPGEVMRAIGPDAGAAFLDSVDAMSASVPRMKWALHVIKNGGVDMADPVARAQIDALAVTGVITIVQADALKALAERRRFPSWAEHNNIVVTARTVGLARGAKE